MPRTVTFQVPALPGAPTETFGASSGNEIDEPYWVPSGSISTSATVCPVGGVALALTHAVSLPTWNVCDPVAPTGEKATENGALPPSLSIALALNVRRLLTVLPKPLRVPEASL